METDIRNIAIFQKDVAPKDLMNAQTSRSLVTAPAVITSPFSRRPHHRIGDRYQDLKDLGHDLDNPAAV